MKELFLGLLLWSAMVFLGGLIGVFVWNWVVPDIFAGMVQSGLLPAEITVTQSLKLSIFLGIFRGFSRIVEEKTKNS